MSACKHAVIVGVAGPNGSTIDKCGDCGLPWDWRTKNVVTTADRTFSLLVRGISLLLIIGFLLTWIFR